jgi:hypothetical protein
VGKSDCGLPKVVLRFRHLKDRGIVNNWPQLRRLVEDYDFPSGRYLGPNTRVWDEAEVLAWWEARPTERPPDKEMARSVAGNNGTEPVSKSVDNESNNPSPQDAQPLLKNGGR